MVILIFGASITYGAWDKEGGWVQRLRKFLDEKVIASQQEFYCITYNLGIDGDTTEDLLERFEFETKQRIDKNEETAFIFAIGTNDSCLARAQNTNLVLPKKFKENIKKLIIAAQKFSPKIVFVGLIPVEEIKVNPFPSSTTGKSYKNEYAQQYNEIIKSVCRENRIQFIEIFEELIKTDYKNLLEDGLHPNSEGHQKIFEIIKEFLILKKII